MALRSYDGEVTLSGAPWPMWFRWISTRNLLRVPYDPKAIRCRVGFYKAQYGVLNSL